MAVNGFDYASHNYRFLLLTLLVFFWIYRILARCLKLGKLWSAHKNKRVVITEPDSYSNSLLTRAVFWAMYRNRNAPKSMSCRRMWITAHHVPDAATNVYIPSSREKADLGCISNDDEVDAREKCDEREGKMTTERPENLANGKSEEVMKDESLLSKGIHESRCSLTKPRIVLSQALQTSSNGEQASMKKDNYVDVEIPIHCMVASEARLFVGVSAAGLDAYIQRTTRKKSLENRRKAYKKGNVDGNNKDEEAQEEDKSSAAPSDLWIHVPEQNGKSGDIELTSVTPSMTSSAKVGKLNKNGKDAKSKLKSGANNAEMALPSTKDRSELSQFLNHLSMSSLYVAPALMVFPTLAPIKSGSSSSSSPSSVVSNPNEELLGDKYEGTVECQDSGSECGTFFAYPAAMRTNVVKKLNETKDVKEDSNALHAIDEIRVDVADAEESAFVSLSPNHVANIPVVPLKFRIPVEAIKNLVGKTKKGVGMIDFIMVTSGAIPLKVENTIAVSPLNADNKPNRDGLSQVIAKISTTRLAYPVSECADGTHNSDSTLEIKQMQSAERIHRKAREADVSLLLLDNPRSCEGKDEQKHIDKCKEELKAKESEGDKLYIKSSVSSDLIPDESAAEITLFRMQCTVLVDNGSGSVSLNKHFITSKNVDYQDIYNAMIPSSNRFNNNEDRSSTTPPTMVSIGQALLSEEWGYMDLCGTFTTSLMTDRIMCCLCTANIASVVTLPCRHTSVCMDCRSRFEACPVCRKPVRSLLCFTEARSRNEAEDADSSDSEDGEDIEYDHDNSPDEARSRGVRRMFSNSTRGNNRHIHGADGVNSSEDASSDSDFDHNILGLLPVYSITNRVSSPSSVAELGSANHVLSAMHFNMNHASSNISPSDSTRQTRLQPSTSFMRRHQQERVRRIGPHSPQNSHLTDSNMADLMAARRRLSDEQKEQWNWFQRNMDIDFEREEEMELEARMRDANFSRRHPNANT